MPFSLRVYSFQYHISPNQTLEEEKSAPAGARQQGESAEDFILPVEEVDPKEYGTEKIVP